MPGFPFSWRDPELIPNRTISGSGLVPDLPLYKRLKKSGLPIVNKSRHRRCLDSKRQGIDTWRRLRWVNHGVELRKSDRFCNHEVLFSPTKSDLVKLKIDNILLLDKMNPFDQRFLLPENKVSRL